MVGIARNTLGLRSSPEQDRSIAIRQAFDLQAIDPQSVNFDHQAACGGADCGARSSIKSEGSVPAANEASPFAAANGVDIPGDTTTNSTIQIGGSITDELESVGDTDWFRITLQAGDTIDISLFGSGSSPVSDTYLRFYDANGNLLSENDDGGEGYNSYLRFIADYSGTFYIEADSYANDKIGEYTINVTESQPLAVFDYDEIALQLTNGYWGGQSRSFDVGNDGILTYDVSLLPQNAAFLAQEALLLWSDVTGIDFVSISGNAEITFSDTESGAYASSTRSGSTITSSTVNISADWIANYGSNLNSYSFQTYIHEIGHALGLGHAGNYNGSASYSTDALYANDAWATTVMSYFSQTENLYFQDRDFTYGFVTTPMNGDVVAMAELYGLSNDTRLGNTIYGFSSNAGRDVFNANLHSTTAYTVVDSGGIDTLNYSGFNTDQIIDLRQEAFSNVGPEIGNVVIARGTVIENGTGGSGDDRINGNSAANILTGNNGDDNLVGYANDDLLIGGAGNDRLAGGGGDDELRGGLGNDNIEGYSGDDLAYGGDGNDFIRGQAGNDEAHGGAGSDQFWGGDGHDVLFGDEGVDFLYGGTGDDRLFGGSESDTIQGNGGNDRIEGGSGFDVLIGGNGKDEIFGDSGDDSINGGAGSDLLFGGIGNDRIIGGGDNDKIFGETGSDTLIGGNGLDVIRGGSGHDTIDGNDGADQLFGDGGDDSIRGSNGWDYLDGGDGNDTLDGGSGADIILGGSGNDILIGGYGDDVFLFDRSGANDADEVVDFGLGNDIIRFDRANGFEALSLGDLLSGAFHVGTSAQDSNDRIIYNQATGELWYDLDGNGSGAAELFATLSPGVVLSASDFQVVDTSASTAPIEEKLGLSGMENMVFA